MQLPSQTPLIVIRRTLNCLRDFVWCAVMWHQATTMGCLRVRLAKLSSKEPSKVSLCYVLSHTATQVANCYMYLVSTLYVSGAKTSFTFRIIGIQRWLWVIIVVLVSLLFHEKAKYHFNTCMLCVRFHDDRYKLQCRQIPGVVKR